MKYCRKCLTGDMDQTEYFRNLHDYIERLDDDIKADTDLYRSRLEQCRQCDRLNDAMCRACGCYVELRAVVLKNNCPYKYW